MMEMPAKTTLRLYCDDSHLVSSVWNHQCTATQFWSIVYKTATVKTTCMNLKGKWSSATKFFFQCVNYMCEGVTRGQSRPIDLKSSFIFIFILIVNISNAPWVSESLYISLQSVVLRAEWNVSLLHEFNTLLYMYTSFSFNNISIIMWTIG